MFTCPECRATFETFDALQAHRLDPYGRKARGEQQKDGRYHAHHARRWQCSACKTIFQSNDPGPPGHCTRCLEPGSFRLVASE